MDVIRVTCKESAGAYVTNTVRGQRASCTISAQEAVRRLAAKLLPDQACEVACIGDTWFIATADVRVAELLKHLDQVLPIVATALQFTHANDFGDACSAEPFDNEALTEAQIASLETANGQADVDYNRTKAELFALCRRMDAVASVTLVGAEGAQDNSKTTARSTSL